MLGATILIDAEIILDWLMDEETYGKEAMRVLEECCSGNVNGYVAAHSITDTLYLANKHMSVRDINEIESNLFKIIKVVPIHEDNITRAMQMEHFDNLEDAIQVQCAVDINADYILTKNVSNFSNSPIVAISYEAFK